MARKHDVVVIGAGQAGLATSHGLTAAGIEHAVLEKGRTGETWRGRWDTFCLVTPNWTVRLPGLPYGGDDPDGFMPRDDIVAHLERYAASFEAPVTHGLSVTRLAPAPDGGFNLETSDGTIVARRVVVATGAYQRPHRVPGAETLPPGLYQTDVESYRSPAGLPQGKVLIVGSGQSGCQIAEELVEAGRDVFLACGRAPWAPRRHGGRDIVWWAVETGFLDQTLAQLPGPAARLGANIIATGHGGGHDLDLRKLRAQGVTLLGHFLGATNGRANFAGDLEETVAWGDARYRDFMGLVQRTAKERGIDVPVTPEPPAFDASSPDSIDLKGLGAVIFASGFRPDYTRWIDVPGAFDGMGFPVQVDGASTASAGLFFVGVHFLRTRGSSLLCGVGADAAVVAGKVERSFDAA